MSMTEDLKEFFKADNWAKTVNLFGKQRPEGIQCPVCGYYCLGKGGYGCINKPALQPSKSKSIA